MVRELSWEQKESQSPLLTRCTGCTAGRKAKNTKDGKLLFPSITSPSPSLEPLTRSLTRPLTKRSSLPSLARSSCFSWDARVLGRQLTEVVAGRLWAGAGQLTTAGHLLSPGAGGEAREGRGTA